MYAGREDLFPNEVDRVIPGKAEHRGRRATVQCGESRCF